ncbi:hypothetical protein SteCoe_410 [Stentor coeruleus]|uniref:RING-CH-type domain-containing protein n=1 Tax=Stentor coeruleus TaxID=5963 RepID=A0A1R2D443_9CILI|nr:hypothetical protein SteCoe_410 [Stentor coeruleus]
MDQKTTILESKDLITSYMSNICRICLNSNPSNLISPCSCSGTTKFAHEACLKTWILMKFPALTTPICEICMEKFKIKVKSRLNCKKLFKVENRSVLLHIIVGIIGILVSLIITFTFTINAAKRLKLKPIGVLIVILTLSPISLYSICIWSYYSQIEIRYSDEDFQVCERSKLEYFKDKL